MKIKLRLPHDDAGRHLVEYDLSEEAKTTWNVQQLKAHLVEDFPDFFKTTEATPTFRLIWNGRILKEEDTLQALAWTEGTTLFVLLQKKKASSTTSAPPSSSTTTTAEAPPRDGPGSPLSRLFRQTMPGNGTEESNGMRDMMAQMLDSPMMQGIMENFDPIRDVMLANPRMQSILDRNPELRHILHDPQHTRDMMRMMRNPQLMQEQMRNQDRHLRNISSLPGGFEALRRAYEDVQPLMDATMDQSMMEGQGTSSPPAPPDGPLPNPWSPTEEVPSSTRDTSGRPPSSRSFLFYNIVVHDTKGTTVGQSSMLHLLSQLGGQPSSASRPQGGVSLNEMTSLLGALQPPSSSGDAQTRNPFLSMMQQGAPPASSTGTNPLLSMMESMMQQPPPASGARSSAGNPFLAMMESMLPPSAASGPQPATSFTVPSSLSTSSQQQEPMTSEQRATLSAQFAEQLQAMADMGFTDTDVNLRALQSSRGSVAIAIERLLNN